MAVFVTVPNPPWHRLNLGQLDGLVELVLHTHILLPLHAALIAHLPPSLRRVRVVLVRLDRRTRGLWAAFDAAFAAPRFAGITLVMDLSAWSTGVGFVVLHQRNLAWVKAHVEAALPRSRARGRLVVEAGETKVPWWGESLLAIVRVA